MSYIDKNLLPDERILFRTKKHLIIFFLPLVSTVVAYYAVIFMKSNPMLDSLTLIPLGLTAFYWIYQGIIYMASEFAVTNKRVMMREGFFVRHSNEMRLSAIAQVNIEQNLLGQLLNFGVVSINGFGGTHDVFYMIASPFEFQKQVNQQVDKATH